MLNTPYYVIATQVRDPFTGFVFVPAAGTVPTADGMGGATWQPGGGGGTVAALYPSGTGQSLVANGVGPNLTNKDLIAGAGITLSSTANDVTITNSSPATGVTLHPVVGSTGVTLAASQTGPALTVRGINAGTGINITGNPTDITIVNTSPATDVSVTPVVGALGLPLMVTPTGPAMKIRNVFAGTGIGVANTGTDMVVTNTSPASSVTLTPTGTGTSLVAVSAAPGLKTKDLLFGTGITFTATTNDVRIINTSPASSVTLFPAAGAAGASLITSGTGPNLALRGLTTDSNIVTSLPSSSDLQLSLNPTLNGITTINGVSGSQLQLSTPGVIGVGGGASLTDFFWYRQPRIKWSSDSAQTSFTPTPATSLNAYFVPLQVLPATTSGNSMVTTNDGAVTYNGTTSRWCDVTYTATTEIGATPGGAAARSLFFYPYVFTGAQPIQPPTTFGSRNYSIVRLPGAPSNVPAQTDNVTVTDQVFLNPNDQIALAVIYNGVFTTAPYPSFSGVSCNIRAMLTNV